MKYLNFFSILKIFSKSIRRKNPYTNVARGYHLEKENQNMEITLPQTTKKFKILSNA